MAASSSRPTETSKEDVDVPGKREVRPSGVTDGSASNPRPASNVRGSPSSPKSKPSGESSAAADRREMPQSNPLLMRPAERHVIALSEKELRFLISRMMILDEKSTVLEEELSTQRENTQKVLEEAEKGLLSAMEKYKGLLEENQRLKEKLVESLTLNAKLTKLVEEASRQMARWKDAGLGRLVARGDGEAKEEADEEGMSASGSEKGEESLPVDGGREESDPSYPASRERAKEEGGEDDREGDDEADIRARLERKLEELEMQHQTLQESRQRERAAPSGGKSS